MSIMVFIKGAPVIEDTGSRVLCKIINQLDQGTSTLFDSLGNLRSRRSYVKCLKMGWESVVFELGWLRACVSSKVSGNGLGEEAAIARAFWGARGMVYGMRSRHADS